jgi:hypothetical protein
MPIFSSCSHSTSPKASGYVTPSLTGWQKDEPDAKGFDARADTYRKRVGATSIRMKFDLIPPSEGEKPDDLVALKKYGDSNLASARAKAPTLKVLEQKETTFRTFPAYLTRTHNKTRRAEIERKVLRVADGKNTFLIDQSLIGNPVDPSARTEANAAWNKFSTELQIP